MIELARAHDLARVVALSNHAAEIGAANFATEPERLVEWERSFEATRATHPWIVARREGEVVGFAKTSPHRARGAYRWIAETSVYIEDAWQGQGLGKGLYDALVAISRAQGYVTLLAGITAGHVASERLHERAGFVRCGTFHRAGWKLGRWHDVGYWELHLQPLGVEPGAIRPVADVWADRAAGDARGGVVIRREAIDGPVATGLIAALDAELARIYPEEGATHFRLDQDEVAPGRGAFVVAWLRDEPVACGAVRRIEDGVGELKRMYVAERVRGRGVATAVLAALEGDARALGLGRLVLETGTRQREALALYDRAGFARIAPFGEYVGSPLSICLAKNL